MAVLTLDYLSGEWTVRRRINHDPDAFGGTASFTPDAAGGLIWRETGTLRLGEYRGPAGRVLIVGGEEVRFEDGRPFHPFRAGALEHRCGPDTYQGEWTVHGHGAFTVRWAVSGPGRADLIVSDYLRAAG